jgi:hypothetical protein
VARYPNRANRNSADRGAIEPVDMEEKRGWGVDRRTTTLIERNSGWHRRWDRLDTLSWYTEILDAI